MTLTIDKINRISKLSILITIALFITAILSAQDTDFHAFVILIIKIYVVVAMPTMLYLLYRGKKLQKEEGN